MINDSKRIQDEIATESATVMQDFIQIDNSRIKNSLIDLCQQ